MGAPKDAEDLGREADHLKAELEGKATAIDQEKVDRELAAFRELAKQPGKRQEAIDGLLGLEKQGRVAEDIATTRKACSAVLEVRAPLPPASQRGRDPVCPPPALLPPALRWHTGCVARQHIEQWTARDANLPAQPFVNSQRSAGWLPARNRRQRRSRHCPGRCCCSGSAPVQGRPTAQSCKQAPTSMQSVQVDRRCQLLTVWVPRSRSSGGCWVLVPAGAA